jgi:hypothetical protein
MASIDNVLSVSHPGCPRDGKQVRADLTGRTDPAAFEQILDNRLASRSDRSDGCHRRSKSCSPGLAKWETAMEAIHGETIADVVWARRPNCGTTVWK